MVEACGESGGRTLVTLPEFLNAAEFWSSDVSEDIAWEVVDRAVAPGSRLPNSTHNFVASHLGDPSGAAG